MWIFRAQDIRFPTHPAASGRNGIAAFGTLTYRNQERAGSLGESRKAISERRIEFGAARRVKKLPYGVSQHGRIMNRTDLTT
jgi:hypothetical protein